MADFDWDWPTKIDRALVEAAVGLHFVGAARNVVLVAPQGLGKTMIAQNIAHQAILAGHSVLFTTAAQMLLDDPRDLGAVVAGDDHPPDVTKRSTARESVLLCAFKPSNSKLPMKSFRILHQHRSRWWFMLLGLGAVPGSLLVARVGARRALLAGLAITGCGWLVQGGALWVLVESLEPGAWAAPGR